MPRGRSVVPCEFSEDEFQALAFAALNEKYRAVVVGGPYLEDRRAERRHGVDAWIAIRAAGAVRVLCFQYKVPKLVINPGLDPECAALFADRPHFRFALHKDRELQKAGATDVHLQHNNLVRLRSKVGLPAVYCAPTYIWRDDLTRAFFRKEIYEKALLGDPADIGYVAGTDSHHVSYSETGGAWGFHSEARELPPPAALDEMLAEAPAIEGSAQSLRRLAEVIEGDLALAAPDEVTGGDENEAAVEAILRLGRLMRLAARSALVLVPDRWRA